MTILRTLVLSLPCPGVLPWGAFARHVEVPTRAADAVLAHPPVAETRRETTAPPKAGRLRDLYRPQMPLDPPKRHE